MIRSARPSDQSYITKTWVRSMLSHHPEKHLPHALRRHGDRAAVWEQVAPYLNTMVNNVVDRGDSRALIMGLDANPDVILGWVVYVDGPAVPIVHYLNVRSGERSKGIATALLEKLGVKRDTGVVCTSNGPSSMRLRSLYPAAVHVPIEEFLR